MRVTGRKSAQFARDKTSESLSRLDESPAGPLRPKERDKILSIQQRSSLHHGPWDRDTGWDWHTFQMQRSYSAPLPLDPPQTGPSSTPGLHLGAALADDDGACRVVRLQVSLPPPHPSSTLQHDLVPPHQSNVPMPLIIQPQSTQNYPYFPAPSSSASNYWNVENGSLPMPLTAAPSPSMLSQTFKAVSNAPVPSDVNTVRPFSRASRHGLTTNERA